MHRTINFSPTFVCYSPNSVNGKKPLLLRWAHLEYALAMIMGLLTHLVWSLSEKGLVNQVCRTVLFVVPVVVNVFKLDSRFNIVVFHGFLTTDNLILWISCSLAFIRDILVQSDGTHLGNSQQIMIVGIVQAESDPCVLYYIVYFYEDFKSI